MSFVQTPYGPGEIVYTGEMLAQVRIPGYLPKTIKPEENPTRIYWFWKKEVDTFTLMTQKDEKHAPESNRPK